MIYHQSSYKAALALALCALLTGCAILCRPNVIPVQSPRLTTALAAGMVDGLGMGCEWRY